MTPNAIPVTALAAYPSYNTHPLPADATGMAADAIALARGIRAGISLGNALDAPGGETACGNPRITPALIRLIRQSGFTAVRLPTSWDRYADQRTGRIGDAWLARVAQVVQWCVDCGLYVIVNIHSDGGWLENHVTPDAQAVVNARQKAYWEQIATTLRGFDEHLMFASANEPQANDAGQMAILLSYHRTFVDAVRSTGGRNAYRVLVVQGPGADIDLTYSLMDKMPADTVPHRQMVEIHYTTPCQFTLMTADTSWGNQFRYWGARHHSATDTAHNATWGEEADLDALYAKMKRKFVDQGIPVVMGEFGAIRRSATLAGADLRLHLESRAWFLHYAARRAGANGMLPFYRDLGGMGNNGTAIFDRHTHTVFDRQALDALLRGANGRPL